MVSHDACGYSPLTDTAYTQKDIIMHVEIRSGNVRLPRAHALGLAQRMRETFGRLAHLIAKVVVRLVEAAKPGTAPRECTIEIHLPNGEVTVVKERQRKLGSLLRRATERAWKAAAAAVAPRHAIRPQPRLPVRARE